MKLTANHRAQLLDSLEATQGEAERLIDLINHEKLEPIIEERTQAEYWLAMERIQTIKRAIIDNDIDY